MGVAGQTSEISLSKNGYKVKIFEKSKQVLSAVGAGIGITGGAICLRELGLDHVVDEIGYQCDRKENYELGSKKPFHFNILETIRGTPLEKNFLFAKRDNLLNALYKECEKDPNITVTLGKKAEAFNEQNDSVTVTFSDGTCETADVAICSDGIHSVGKHYIEGENFAKPEHSGLCVFYAVTKTDDKLDPLVTYQVDLGGGECLTMPIGDGERMIVLAHEANEKWNSNSEDWSYSCTPQDFYKLFEERGWFESQSIISKQLVKNVERILHLGIYQQQILKRWHKGRVCIIGDAAHATSPFIGQGANQATRGCINN